MKEPCKSQKQAITHLSGPAQVIAGPGSGKTYTIIQRILYLTGHYHIAPDKILVITYTKAAAAEMKERYEKTRASAGNVWFGTFHSICYNILRQCGASKTGSLISISDQRKLLQVILGNHGYSSECTYEVVTYLINVISCMKNKSKDALDLAKSNTLFSADSLLRIREEYDQYLREQGMLDFDDMILECFRFLVSHSDICRKYQERFEYILVDEFQDINPPQYQLLKLLAAPSGNLFVVGDDDQAIYGFRGATPGIMKQFQQDFQNPLQILLTENYRSKKEIVRLAERMISRNTERFLKDFRPVKEGGTLSVTCFDTHKEEEQALVRAVLDLKPQQQQETAVILRTNREVIQFRELLKNAGVAVKGKCLSGDDFFRGFIMEDLLAFLSFLYEGNQRRDFICFMNKPNRFLTRSALWSEVVKKEQLEQYYQKNAAMLSEIRTLFEQLHIAATLQPYLAVSLFRKTLGYEQYLHEIAKSEEEYQRMIKQTDRIQCCFKEFHAGNCRHFMETKVKQELNAPPRIIEGRGVNVLTMHGAKGLEFDRVFLPDVNEGIIPGKESLADGTLEEERRLLYVAITRARNELTIYYTKERGRKLSRFLEGIIPSP